MIAALALAAVVVTDPPPPPPKKAGPIVIRSIDVLQRYMLRCESREGIVLVTESEGDMVAACVKVRFNHVEVPE